MIKMFNDGEHKCIGILMSLISYEKQECSEHIVIHCKIITKYIVHCKFNEKESHILFRGKVGRMLGC